MVERLGNLDGATVLNVGCGTGNNFPLLVPRVGVTGHVIGVDYSAGMLARAERRAERAGFRGHPAGGRIAIMDFVKARPDRGPLKPLYPAYRRLLIAAGIDAPEDLDDERLRARWHEGRAMIREHLSDVIETRYLWGAGMLISGTR